MKITLLTTGQPSTNPRLVKEADALAAAGYEVTVLYCYWADWATETDKKLLASRPWKAILVGGSPQNQPWRWYYTRLRKKLSKSPERTLCRAFDELLALAVKTPADLYIAHNLGTLPVAALASQKTGKPFGFDAEDFHREEEDPGLPQSRLKAEVESKYLPGATYTTAASPLIAAAYKSLFPDKQWQPVLNVFSLRQQPAFWEGDAGPLKLFWFSQTIGRNRGLEDLLDSLSLLTDLPVEITLQGSCTPGEKAWLEAAVRPPHLLRLLPPAPEDELIRETARCHLGLALERRTPPNRNICLTNKIFTYLLAGAAVIASDTDAQKQFMAQHPGIGQVYPIGDAEALAAIIRHYHENRAELEAARRRAWELARTELNWEKEQHKFLELVEKALAAS